MISKDVINRSVMKERNRASVLQTLWLNSPISRTMLAKETGLNKATITNVISYMESHNMITDVGIDKSKPGKAQSLIMFNKFYGICAGVIFRPKVTYIAISDVYASILWQSSVEFEPDEDKNDIISRIIKELHIGLDKCKEYSSNLIGIGVGSASLLHEDDNVMYEIHSLAWKNIPLVQILKDEFNVPVIADTASNNAAIGEKYFGLSKNLSNEISLQIGYGIGGGIIASNHLYRGTSGFAGDIGHMTIDPKGPLCRCGKRGCWEVMSSEITLGYHSFEEYVERAEKGDKEAIKQLSSIAKNLAIGLSSLISILNPSLIILGGDITVCGKWIMNPLLNELKNRTWPFIFAKTKIEYSSLGQSAATKGTLMRVIETLF